MPNPPKEYQWKPGQSGNPKGRPKGTTITEQLLKLADGVPEGEEKPRALLAAEKAWELAMAGDDKLLKILLDRMEGPVKQIIEAQVEQAIKAIDKGAAEDV